MKTRLFYTDHNHIHYRLQLEEKHNKKLISADDTEAKETRKEQLKDLLEKLIKENSDLRVENWYLRDENYSLKKAHGNVPRKAEIEEVLEANEELAIQIETMSRVRFQFLLNLSAKGKCIIRKSQVEIEMTIATEINVLPIKTKIE